jgi:hypothetical protein
VVDGKWLAVRCTLFDRRLRTLYLRQYFTAGMVDSVSWGHLRLKEILVNGRLRLRRETVVLTGDYTQRVHDILS